MFWNIYANLHLAQSHPRLLSWKISEQIYIKATQDRHEFYGTLWMILKKELRRELRGYAVQILIVHFVDTFTTSTARDCGVFYIIHTFIERARDRRPKSSAPLPAKESFLEAAFDAFFWRITPTTDTHSIPKPKPKQSFCPQQNKSQRSVHLCCSGSFFKNLLHLFRLFVVNI